VCNDVLCVVLCMVWVIKLSPTHAILEHLTVLETESLCWLSQHLMLLKMTGRSPREAPTNNCESWKQLLQHEHGYVGLKWQTSVWTNDRASHAVYFQVVHRSCVVSVDQVDTCRESKYLACVPWCPCEIPTADARLAMPG